MPSDEAIASEKERLYESSSLRDDLNDDEATVLLTWGETQIERLANEFPDEFEQKARFFRQVLKNINRFVGQREFNDLDGQTDYMDKITKYLESVGWGDVTTATLLAALPDDKADMAANLSAILGVLSPTDTQVIDDNPVTDTPMPIDDNPLLAGGAADEDIPLLADPNDENNSFGAEQTEIPVDNEQPLENSNTHSINHFTDTYRLGETNDYGED
ncbi:MAG: hypothetical protein WBC91_07745 [Phototrophicaceae bacterium]